MARTKVFLSGTVFVFFVLLTLPAATQQCVGDEWGMKFVKLAGDQDANMPAPSLDYDPEAQTYTMTAAGHDIWDQQDGCGFAYVPVTGGIAVVVRVDQDFSGPATHSWSKAGIMVRDSLTPESKYVFYCTSRGEGKAMMQWRDADNSDAGWSGEADVPADDPAVTYPYFLRLDSEGGSLNGYYSRDGENWVRGSSHIGWCEACTPPLYVGLALTSHEESVPTTMVFSQFHLEGPQVAPSPDLVITDIWNEDTRICYQVRNIGNARALEGHTTALTHADNVVTDLVGADLNPGQRYRGCFDYEWSCLPPEDPLWVDADCENSVRESDETNNTREEIWKCDTSPPQITSGPEVRDITQTSAFIVWETNEASDSVVGCAFDVWDFKFQYVSDPTQATAHNITLTELNPSTTYVAMVESTDASGNTVTSKRFFFQALPAPDDVDPTVSIELEDPFDLQGTVFIPVAVHDNTGVDKVEFYLDGELVHTAYTGPYDLKLDTTLYANGDHTLTTKAYDFAGRTSAEEREIQVANAVDLAAPQVTITYPSQGETVSHKIIVTANVTDDTGLTDIVFYVDGDQKAVEHGAPPFPVHKPVQFTWDTTKVTNGTYRLGVKAWDIGGKTGLATVDVDVWNPLVGILTLPTPDLVIDKHEVSRNKNVFTIELTLKNNGTAAAKNVYIRDWIQGFQPISRGTTTPISAKYQPKFYTSSKSAVCCITDYTDIPKGKSHTYTFSAIPILFYSGAPTPSIGHIVRFWYDGEYGTKHSKDKKFKVLQTKGNEPIATAYKNALKSSDYLIITNPSGLSTHNPSSVVDNLLSDMAQLAVYREGVLGYLSIANPASLRKLIIPSGTWAKQLHPSFAKTPGIGGYVLIVGETEIIPAWSVPHGGGYVYHSDLYYAQTYGGWRPELNVGRIIGDDAADLRTPIGTSIGVYQELPGHNFDRSHALGVSGHNGHGGWIKDIDDMEKILTKKGSTVSKIHWTDKKYLTNAQRLQDFRNSAPNKDIIWFSNHCNPDCWCPGLVTNNFPVNFGNAKPFILGLCCDSGNYEANDDDNIAENFLQSGAAVYMGSTMGTGGGPDNKGGKAFFNKWDANKTVGWAFTSTKRLPAGSTVDEITWRYWGAEYNLYGDPKFGQVPSAQPSPPASPAQKAPQEPPPPSIEVVVPDYEVTTIRGVHYVEIPDGLVLLHEDMPEVSYYPVSLDIPAGYMVRDVVLADRSGLVTDTGLNLPLVSMLEKSSPGAAQLSSAEGESWYPQQDYNWHLIENPDGSSTLVIVIYPFYYNPQTSDVRFYKNYTFDINSVVSTVSITSLSTDKDEYERGEMVGVNVEVYNSGEPQDLIVSAVIKRPGTEQIAAGLPLRTLEQVSGPASCLFEWDSTPEEICWKYVDVTLKDAAGNVLDRQTALFTLGISSAQVTLDVTPQVLTPDTTEVLISTTFTNTGTEPIEGSAMVRVCDSAGEEVLRQVREITGLMPGDSLISDDAFEITDPLGSYRVLAYALFDSKSCDPAVVNLYPVPSAPTDLNVDMLLAGNLSWEGPETLGVVGYNVYRSEDGGPSDLIAYVTDTSYVDPAVVPEHTYNYMVAAVNEPGAEGSLSEPTGDSMIVMEIRQAEDFNYGQGQWPGHWDCPAANEAPSSAEVGAPDEYDYYYAAHFEPGDWHRSYRPEDDVGMHGYPEDDPDAIGLDPTVIGWTTEGDWWRYTFDVPQQGWIKLVLRLASPRQAALVHCFWDEQPIGAIEFATGSYHQYDDFPLDPFESAAGEHTLRVKVAEGQGESVLNFDKIGIGYNWAVPMAPPWGNLLSNPGFESELEGWTTDHGAIRQGGPSPHGGANYLMGGMDGSSRSYTYQTVDLMGAGFGRDDLDAGFLEVRFGGWQAGWQTQTDSGKIEIIVTDGTNELARSDLGWFYSNDTWVFKEGAIPLPQGARFITYGFYAERFQGSNNDGYLDDAFLELRMVTRAIRVSDDNLILQWVPFGDGKYFIEQATDLAVGDWTQVAGPLTGTAFSVSLPEDPAAYFRVRSQ